MARALRSMPKVSGVEAGLGRIRLNLCCGSKVQLIRNASPLDFFVKTLAHWTSPREGEPHVQVRDEKSSRL